MKNIFFIIFLVLFFTGCSFSKKEKTYSWPTYQITETKKDTSGVELKVVIYEYYRQTKKEKFTSFAEEIFKEQKNQYFIKLKKGEKAKLLKLKKIEFYFQNKYPYKSTKGNALTVINDKDTRKKEWQTSLGEANEEGFQPNDSWWEIALTKRVPGKDK